MEVNVEKYMDGIFSEEAFEQPSDTEKPEQLEFRLPPWFDEKKFNKGRQFYWNFSFGLTTSMSMGLIAVFAVPSILRVLISSRRSSTVYTAYKRYLSTILHTLSWFENDLRPGSVSWRSLLAVRSRHIRAGSSAKIKGDGIISQRDLALTQFGFLGFSLLRPDAFGIRQLEKGDWDAYVHFWRVIGHTIGIKDRYNLCRPTLEETRQVCQIISDTVFTPCLTHVPEYFEYMARQMLEGLWNINPSITTETYLYMTKYLANVPGYFYTETERINLQKRILERSQVKSGEIGTDISNMISKPNVTLEATRPRVLYYDQYESAETSPEYKRLQLPERYQLSINIIIFTIYSSYLGRLIVNLIFRWSILLMKYFPYRAFFKYGIRKSFVNIFIEDPKEDAILKPNSEYEKPKTYTWFETILSFF